MFDDSYEWPCKETAKKGDLESWFWHLMGFAAVFEASVRTFSFARSSTYGSGRDSGISCHHSSIGKLNSCQLFSTSGFAFGLFVELDIGPSTTCYALSARSNASNQWPPQHLSWWWCSLEVQHKFLEYVQAQVAEQTSVSFSNISRITADHGTSKLDRMHENATS